jgi:hypothetical protein
MNEALSPALKINPVETLTENNRTEVLDFLKARPVHTVIMASFIRDNGMENADNRGRFYGYRNSAGELEGVALIGHTTLIEARSEEALKAFDEAHMPGMTRVAVVNAEGEILDCRPLWGADADLAALHRD